MMARLGLRVLVAAICLSWGTWVSAATYYVDFSGGDDARDGLSPATAWKHAPGDAAAADKPAAVKLAPGDTVVFRGGVAYHGAIRVASSGEAGKPITLDGNTSGVFGSGRAILDGGRVITGWRRCASAAEARGHARWRDLFYADIDVDITPNVSHGEFVVHRQMPRDRQAPWQRVILIDGDRRLLPISQFPKPKDAFYPDLPADFLQSSRRLEATDTGSVITDEINLKVEEASYYDGMFVGVHGGNNHVYFGKVVRYDPKSHQLCVPRFTATTYPTTRYAFYNSPRLIEQPGEWAVESIPGGRTRVYLLPERLENDQPVNIGFPEFETGVSIDSGASHIHVKGFLVQRYSGGAGGVSVSRNTPRAHHVTVSDCEIRFISGHAGVGLNYCDDIVVEKCYIHHCPAWTTGVFLSRVNRYEVRDCYLEKNSGSGIRHYECKEGVVRGNAILDHFGMHSSGINVYEGCANVLLENNYVQNTVTINRNAENIVFRNNVIDGMGRSAVCLAMWGSGQTGGRDIKNVQFLNNTFVNTNPEVGWASGLLGQRGKAVSSPQDLVVRGNILDRITDDVNGVFENNIYLRDVEARFMGQGCLVVKDPKLLFKDAAQGDFRRVEGGPAMDAGADLSPPPPRPAGF
jgi:hypothetical protein